MKIAGLDVYVAEPSSFDGKALLFLTDIFGFQFLNNQLLADDFAKLGNLRVYVADLFHGDAPSWAMFENPEFRAQFDINAFRETHNDTVFWSDFLPFLEEIKEKQGVKKVGTIGYCCGGRYSIKLGGTDYVDAVAGAHPSRVEIPQDIQNIKKPSLFLFSEIDNLFTPEVIETTKKILEAKKPQVSIFHHYPGTSHEFAVRGRRSDDKLLLKRQQTPELKS